MENSSALKDNVTAEALAKAWGSSSEVISKAVRFHNQVACNLFGYYFSHAFSNHGLLYSQDSEQAGVGRPVVNYISENGQRFIEIKLSDLQYKDMSCLLYTSDAADDW